MGTFSNTWGNMGRGYVDSLPSLSSLTNKMAFWSDGTIVNGQLPDLSGNGRHATVSDNIVTDGSAEFGSILDYWTTPNTCTNSTEQKHSGSKSFKFSVTGAVTTAGARTKKHRTFLGETVTWSIWFYRTVNTTFMLQVYKGDGTVAYQNGKSPTLNTWVNYTGSYTETAPGGMGGFGFYISSGDLTMYIDDMSIIITGKPNIGITMADDATLKAIDTKNLFYTTDGIPKTLRSDIGDPTIENRQLFCGGENKFIFLKENPDVNTEYLLYEKFVDHTWVFTSCENRKTVGVGGQYATLALAKASIPALPTLTNRYAIDLLDDIVLTDFAQYADIGVYNNYFQFDKRFIYLCGFNGVKTITANIPASSSDANIAKIRVLELIYEGGMRNIKIVKGQGGYALHIDSSGQINGEFTLLNCETINLGIQDVVDYRIANSLALPNSSTGGITPLGMGMANGQMTNFINHKSSGVHPLTNHGGHSSGAPAYMTLYKCQFTSLALYIPTYNPTSALMAGMRLDSTPGTNTVKSIAHIMKSTFNVPISSNVDWDVSVK